MAILGIFRPLLGKRVAILLPTVAILATLLCPVSMPDPGREHLGAVPLGVLEVRAPGIADAPRRLASS